MCTYLVGCLILIIYAVQSNCAFSVKPIKLELLEQKFRVSLPNEPGIKMVYFHININKEFRSFEDGQLSGLATNLSDNDQWSYEFSSALQATDVVYLWLTVQYKSLLYRDRQGPISTSGNPPTSTAVTISTITSNSPNGSMDADTTMSTSEKPVNQVPVCLPAITQLSGGETYCIGDIVFEDNFDGILSSRWINEARIPLDINDAEFVVYNGSAIVVDGVMQIRATLKDLSVNKGFIDLQERCTSFNYKECRLKAEGSYYLPPVESGRINSKESFSFKYGRIEVRAKLPKGDWLVPLISLEPTMPKYGPGHYINGEMRIAFARGNTQLMSGNTNIDGMRLFGGIIFSNSANLRHKFMANVTLDQVNGIDEHFGNQYHLYSMIWKPEEILLFVDGYQYGKIKTNFKETLNDIAWRNGPENAPLDQMYHLTLGLSVGGHGDFPSDSEKLPWKNGSPRAIPEFYKNRGEWHTRWDRPELAVDFVRVYAI